MTIPTLKCKKILQGPNLKMLVIRVTLFGAPYTICYVTEQFFMLPNEQHLKSIGFEKGDCVEIDNEINIVHRKPNLVLSTSALFLQPLMKCLLSDVFRKNLMVNMIRWSGSPVNGPVFKLRLKPPDKEIIDYAWNDRMLKLIWTRVEIENAFSWLSTLGGAYSALGDYFQHCAEEAGRISHRQYKLSIMLGDESLAARSKLYSALSCAQKGKLNTSRHIVRKINQFAIETKDKRLNRMCQGVWAKLKYLRSLSKQSCDGVKSFL